MTRPSSQQPDRKPRVAVVFGGRSSRARRLVRRPPAACCAAIDRDALRRRADRHRHATATGSSRPATPSALRAHAPATLPEVDADAARRRRAARAAADRTLVVHEAGAAAAQPRRGRRRLPAAARPVRRGRHHPGPARARRRPLRRRRGAGLRGRHGQALHEGRLRRPPGSRSARTPSITDRAVAARPGGRAWTPSPPLGYPVFVKPARAGSSMGITKVDDPRGPRGRHRGGAASTTPRSSSRPAIVRPRDRVRGARGPRRRRARGPAQLGEIAVARRPRVLRLRGQVPRRGSDVALDLPGRPAGRRRRARSARWRRAPSRRVGCEGLARVDFFYTDDGDVVVNEINTMPGFTPHSMYPRMWAASGLDYPELSTS